MYDLSIIKYSILSKDNYNNISKYIDVKDLTQELQGIFRVISVYYEDNDAALSVDDVANFFFATNPKDKDFYIGVFDNLKSIECSEQSALALAVSLKRASVLRKLAETSYEASEGKKEPLEAVKGLYEQLAKLDNTEDVLEEDLFASVDLDEILEQQKLHPGLDWRLKTLRQTIGPIRKGNFIFAVARPESGKTAWLLSEGSYLAEQADGYTLHLSNEEAHDAVMFRYHQATLGLTREQILANTSKAKAEFLKRVGNKLLFRDNAVIHAKEVERWCEQYKPKLLLVDQIDKIKGFENDREDLKLGAIYQFFREIAKAYCPVIAVTQANTSGEGVKWLEMNHVSNSGTAKQAEADVILGIGKIHDPGYERLRFFNLSKNKLPGGEETKPEWRHHRWETLLDAERVRYLDL